MRLTALIKKEMLQIFRDPSSLIIAFILPMLLLFLFGFGLSLDAKDIPFGIAIEDSGHEARDLAMQFYGSKYFIPAMSAERQELLPHLVSDGLKAVLVIPNGFSASIHSGRAASVGFIIDGAFPNTGAMIQNYGLGAISQWTARNYGAATPVNVAPRYWYNNEMDSRYSIIPGIMAMIMALIGTMLTSLVVAREWERGTMEALLSTPLNKFEILLGKLVPYYLLAILSTFLSLGISVWLFDVPYRGSVLMLFCVGSLFMLSSLGQGLIISTVTKNQFLASFAALLSAFMPTVLLSGFLFEINSMPLPQRALAAVLPSRYLVTCLQTLFLAGNVWGVLIPNMIKLAAIGIFFIGITLIKTPKRL
ncbi:MAG: ABC transporter permease [Synergistaceae bacterium]|nr:ABC transporter permease [Synergistaceae bacterium]